MRSGDPRVLFVSNGHGEDAIACRIIDHVRRAAGARITVEAWPMVGPGDAYRANGLPIVGSSNMLPSEGFATLSLALLARDLRAGWIDTHVRQWRAAVELRDRYDLAVAIGDVVPMVAARLARLPFLFVGCAKSAYYGPGWGYSRLERFLLRRGSVGCFPRDRLTVTELAQAGTACSYVGNPMMDGLESSGKALDVGSGARVIACLPGSRGDSESNAASILRLVALEAAEWHAGDSVEFVFALPRRFQRDRMIEETRRVAGATWDFSAGGVDDDDWFAQLGASIRARFVRHRFADVLHSATAAIGLAGTANEQAIGLGVPVVTFATGGSQGHAYLRMKMRYFGESVIEVDSDPRELRVALERMMNDAALRESMVTAGRERMGAPGASKAIARHLVERLMPAAAFAT